MGHFVTGVPDPGHDPISVRENQHFLLFSYSPAPYAMVIQFAFLHANLDCCCCLASWLHCCTYMSYCCSTPTDANPIGTSSTGTALEFESRAASRPPRCDISLHRGTLLTRRNMMMLIHIKTYILHFKMLSLLTACPAGRLQRCPGCHYSSTFTTPTYLGIAAGLSLTPCWE